MNDKTIGLYQILGINISSKIVINSILFAIIIFFYALTIGTILHPDIYPLLNRVTYSTPFVDKYYFNQNLDSLIIICSTFLWFNFALKINNKLLFLLLYGIFAFISFILDVQILKNIILITSFPSIITLIIINKFSHYKLLEFNKIISLNYISIFGIVIGLISFYVSLIIMVNPGMSLPSINYLYYIFLILSTLSPLCLLSISFAYPINKIKTLTKNKINIFMIKKDRNSINLTRNVPNLRKKIFQLFIIVLLSIVISLIPHYYFANKDNQIIGSDTPNYVKMIIPLLNTNNFGDLLKQAFIIQMGGDRPFSLLLFFSLSQFFEIDKIPILLEYLPILLSPLLVLSIYFLTLEISKNHLTALISSLFTIPFHILIGIYGGLYSNWLSLIFGYLAILFLFRSLNNANSLDLIIFSLMLVTLLFCHTPTWNIFLYVLIIFLISLFIRKKYNYKLIFLIFLCILPSIAIDLGKMILINKSGFIQEYAFAKQQDVGIHNLYLIWKNLVDTSHLYMAGLLGNPIVLLLVLYWIFKSEMRENYSVFLIIFFSLSILPILFAEQEIQTRFFYEIPFQIPAAIAIMMLKKTYGNILPFTICLWIIILCIRNISNFHLIIK